MPIKVLVVDDSALMRSVLTRMINSDPELIVIGVARDGEDALNQIAALKPDLVTLDIEMPKLDGLGCLAKIMETHPLPVLMVSYLAVEGAEPTIKALELGAIDFITKTPTTDSTISETFHEELIQKIKIAARIQVAKAGAAWAGSASAAASPVLERPALDFKSLNDLEIVGIGASTGGPKALHRLLPLFPANFPFPVVVAQHMPKEFTRVFAARLNEFCALEVREAENGQPIRPGGIYFAPSGYQTRIVREQNHLTAEVFDLPRQLYKPSIDILFDSLAETCKHKVLGVILTGMGADGSVGMKRIRLHGGRTMAEAEETCVVFGMPRAAIENGSAEFIETLPNIFPRIIDIVTQKKSFSNP